VIVLSGDGSLLMNLGTMVTISAQAPANLVVVVFVNGVYEVTGAQATPAEVVATSTSAVVDYESLARASGIASVFRWSTIGEWRNGVRAALDVRGPTVVILDVAPVPDAVGPRSPGPTRARAARFMRALNADPDESA
jgi:thiamine pyrophosphate-dependent acetolactate synthase large subunit-like protein